MLGEVVTWRVSFGIGETYLKMDLQEKELDLQLVYIARNCMLEDSSR
jgi:hypothetical protein